MCDFWRSSLVIASLFLLACANTGPLTAPPAAPTPTAARAIASPTAPTGQTSPNPTTTATAIGTASATPPATALRPTATATPTVTPPRPFAPRAEVVATGLEVPWALAFAPDGRLFLTERPGRIRVAVNGRLLPEPVATLPVATSAESGLMGIALDPDFSANRFLYVMYTYRSSRGDLRNLVSRLVERNNRAAGEVVLLDDIPGAAIHDGGRLKFGPDGKLYVTTGDAASGSLAQERSSLAGKILRLNPDGSAPRDNPFPGSPIYSYGHRNPQGLDWHPGTGDLFATEHGPTGNDEVNVILAGQNYGWPDVAGRGGAPRYVDPILALSPSVAPSGAAFYAGRPLAPWTGDFFFTTLRGEHLHRVTLGGPDRRQVERTETLFQGVYGRLRDVVLGPDGYLYFTTSNRDGRGRPAADDDRILRIVPARE